MSTALYRRYRPESFDDVIGQDHVTEPLAQALRSGRVNHAYLFSGPRGCGKTTSARILARCLNCEQGPTPTPCGTCASCRELARGGSGSLDVVEIDAASHGGVDDARELRERATMAPARDRFRIYIIDEAHMVSNQGFNALLKLVEEPPEHVMFVFATTEPDKVLQTIRSRTHHYSFRLVPPEVLVKYLDEICAQEQVSVGKGVLPLVVRAGAGSVRDSLSVLDQLIGGADADGLDYVRSLALLGYTDAALLDDVVNALGSADGAALFTVVDRVVQSGHDPKRFVEDLLERLRDLILLQAIGQDAEGVLRHLPPDQMERMRTQSTYLGPSDLSRAADVVNAALNEMVGASSPRMHLELLCARLLLPAAESGDRGLGARVDRIERRLSVAPPHSSAPDARPEEVPPVVIADPIPAPKPVQVDEEPAREPAPPPETAATAESAAGDAVGAVDTEALRRMWPDVLRQVQGMRRSTWMIISANAQVHRLDNGVLELAFSNQGTARGFAAGQHPDVVAAAVAELLGITVRVQAAGDADSSPEPAPRAPSEEAPAADPASDEEASSGPQEPAPRTTRASRAARAAATAATAATVAPEDDTATADDPDADDSGMAGTAVVEEMLGGRVIDIRPGG